KEMCDPKIMGNTTMCKQCEESCQPWKLQDACLLSKLTYLFDNDATIFFSIFMSFWVRIHWNVGFR
ncbi:Anoctamin, partial [Caligus rogercresseyi]